jgi:hypothetical protein
MSDKIDIQLPECWSLHHIGARRELLFFSLFLEKWEKYQKKNVSSSVPYFYGEQSLQTFLSVDQYVGVVLFDLNQIEIVGHVIGQVTPAEQFGVCLFTEKTRRISNLITDPTTRCAAAQRLRDTCFEAIREQYFSQPTFDGQSYVLKWCSLYPGKTTVYSVPSGVGKYA